MFCVGGKDGNNHLDCQNSSENSFEEISGNSIEEDSNDEHSSGENQLEETHDNSGCDQVDVIIMFKQESQTHCG